MGERPDNNNRMANVRRRCYTENFGESYAIGVAEPVPLFADIFGTGDPLAAIHFLRQFDFRPKLFVERSNLLGLVYR